MREPYPDYRQSGIPWLGQVPSHWEVKRLKWSSRNVINGVWGEEPDGENDIACVRVADFDRLRFEVRMTDPTIRSVEPPQRAGRELHPGDLLIEKSGGGDKQIVGAVMYYSHGLPAVSSNFIGRITTTKDDDPKFWTYVHAMLYAGRLTYPAIKQTTGIQNLDTSAYFDTEVGFPPHDEQSAIAAFLDRETGRIDRLIAEHELLIECLAEYRNTVITRAVTRGLPPGAACAAGLDPEPLLKPSGIQWTDDIPGHWEIKRLKYTATTNDDAIAENGDPLREVVYVDIGSISPSKGITTADEMVFEDAPTRARRLVQDGDTIVSTVRTYLRAVAPVYDPPPEMVVSTGFAVIRPREIDSGYCSWVLREHRFIEQVVANSNGVSYPAINARQIGQIPITLPPIPEQRAIAQYLDQKTERIDVLSQRAETAIERLNEYRTALITAVVTGKIDVRKSVDAEEPTE